MRFKPGPVLGSGNSRHFQKVQTDAAWDTLVTRAAMNYVGDGLFTTVTRGLSGKVWASIGDTNSGEGFMSSILEAIRA